MNTPLQAQTQIGRDLPPENNFPLTLLLDTSFIKSTIEENCCDKHKKVVCVEIGFVRYNPGVSCMICYNIFTQNNETGLTDEAVFYAASFAGGHYRLVADRVKNQRWLPGSICASPMVVDSLQAVFYQFPNDMGLPKMKVLAEPEKFSKIIKDALDTENVLPKIRLDKLVACHRLRYKPENRFIARCEFKSSNDLPGEKQSASILIRFERGRNSENAFRQTQSLYDVFRNNSRINLPRPSFFIHEYNLQAYEWIEAEKLSELLRGNEPDKSVVRAANILSALHRSKVSDLPQHRASFFEERIQHTVDFFAFAGEDIKNQSGEIAKSLMSYSTKGIDGSLGLVHGDFHQGQLLVADDKDYVLDFSRSHWGETTADIGNFMAQLSYWQLIGRLENVNKLEALFVSTYEGSRKLKVPEQRIRFWKTFGLFELAVREFRRLKPGWPDKCGRLLQECRETLDS